MLRDEDRIFTNLYGWHGWDLESSKKRGIWDDTKALIALGREKIIEEVKTSGLRGRGGGGLPDRHEMVVHAEGGEPGPAVLPGDQRR